MNTHADFLATTYIADRQREALSRTPHRSRDNSRQIVYRASRDRSGSALA